jgi:hypothetical protein
MALWVLISATLFRRAVLVLWHAFLFLGLRSFLPFFLFLAWWPPLLSLVSNLNCLNAYKVCTADIDTGIGITVRVPELLLIYGSSRSPAPREY